MEKIINRKTLLFSITTLCVVSLGIFFTFKNVFQESSTASRYYKNPENQLIAIMETADAYVRQGVQIQYDSYRRNVIGSPEDATSQHFNYTVCSGFVHMVYYHTFGISLPQTTKGLSEYAYTNRNTENVVFFYSNIDTDSDIEKIDDKLNYYLSQGETAETAAKALAKELALRLKKGDIIDYVATEKNDGELVAGSGHAMLVSGLTEDGNDVTIIESVNGGVEDFVGGGYDYTTHTDRFDTIGSIQNDKHLLSDYLLKMAKKVGSDKYARLVGIRIVTNGKTYFNTEGKKVKYKMNGSAKTRLEFPQIDIEKTVEITDANGVLRKSSITATPGDMLKFTLSVKNSSHSAYSNLTNVIENVDSELEIVGANNDGDVNSDQISWVLPELSPGETKTYYYSVRIPENCELNEVHAFTGKVGEIATSNIEIRISKMLTNLEQEKLLQELSNGNNEYERSFINQIYKNALGIDLMLTNDIKNLDIINYSSEDYFESGINHISVRHTMVQTDNEKIKNSILGNYFGLRIAKTESKKKAIVGLYKSWRMIAPNENLGSDSRTEADDRARTLTTYVVKNDGTIVSDGEVQLETGDIILAYTEDGIHTQNGKINCDYDPDDTTLYNKAYIFVRTSEYPKGAMIRKKSNGETELLRDYDMTLFLNNMVGGDNYIVLRPSQINN